MRRGRVIEDRQQALAVERVARHRAGQFDYRCDNIEVVDQLLTNAVGLVRRQWPIISAALVTSLALALGYLLVTPASYLAKTHLLLDTRKLQLFQTQSVLSEVSFDAPAVESQIEILKSESIARSVVEELKLAEDPEFTGNVTSFFRSLKRAVSAP